MKSTLALSLALLLPAWGSATAPSQPPIPQEELGNRLIQTLMRGDSAAVAPFFAESVRPNLTEERLQGIRAQIRWVYNVLGGGFEQFMSGRRVLPHGGDTVFFREYRIANERDKRAPLVLVHLWFRDSTADQAQGMLVKMLSDGSERSIRAEETWQVAGRKVDVNAVVLVEYEKAYMLAVKLFDDDTAAFGRDSTYARAVPIAHEAYARGLLKEAKKQIRDDKPLLPDIGVCFIRKVPTLGFSQAKIAIRPNEYGGPDSLAADTASAAPAKAAKADVKKTGTTKGAKKK